jgi:hypothetical protein
VSLPFSSVSTLDALHVAQLPGAEHRFVLVPAHRLARSGNARSRLPYAYLIEADGFHRRFLKDPVHDVLDPRPKALEARFGKFFA